VRSRARRRLRFTCSPPTSGRCGAARIWWADLPAPARRRLVVLLSRDEAYAVRELVTVAPVTTRVRDIPTEVPLGPGEGLPKACVVNLDTITTIPRRALTQAVSSLPPDKLAAVERALTFALGLTDLEVTASGTRRESGPNGIRTRV
jgi:mRNA interferase MazF